MVLDVAGLETVDRYGLELRQKLVQRLLAHVYQSVQPASVSHSDGRGFHSYEKSPFGKNVCGTREECTPTFIGSSFQELLHRRYEGVAALQTESLLRAVLLGQKGLEGHGAHDVPPNPLSVLLGQLGRTRGLELVPDPVQLRNRSISPELRVWGQIRRTLTTWGSWMYEYSIPM